jgi:signal transduction histidine kinase
VNYPIKAKIIIMDISVLARDVRNPLTSIDLSIDMLNTAVTDREFKVYTDIISRSSKRINQIIDELLERQEVRTVSPTNY